MRAVQLAITSSFTFHQDMTSMYGAPPSLAMFIIMEEDEELVDEVAADQKEK